jgi:spermidine synthase
MILAQKRYDLIVVDLYHGSEIPEFVSESVFLENMKKLLGSSGRLVVNYSPDDDSPRSTQLFIGKLKQLFPTVLKRKFNHNEFIFVGPHSR